MTGRLKYKSFSENRKPMLTFELERVNDDELKSFEDKVLDIEVKVSRKKRSLNANAYMWALCDKLSEKVDMPREDIYRRAIKEVGLYKDFHQMSEGEEKTLMKAWSLLGVGWFAERLDYEPDGEHTVVRAYYGSSSYNSKAMARLIDHIKQDAKSLGIETMSDQELSLLIDNWGKAKGDNKC